MHNELVRRETVLMLKAGIFIPASLAWSLANVIALKKDGKPQSCVAYRSLNARMKAGRVSSPNIQESFKELTGAAFFRTLELLS